MRRLLGSTLARALLLFTAFAAHASDVTVFASTSLTDVLKKGALIYEKRTGDKVVFKFGPSSFLERQIEEGASADIFFSADEEKMNQLERHDRILKDTRKNRLSNELVIVVPIGSNLKIASPSDLATNEVKQIAIADTKVGPSGIYSKTYLKKVDVWPSVESKVIPCNDSRAALAAVESGKADAGMVFKTDARLSKKAKIAFEIPPQDTPDICYPMAVVRDSKQVEAARKFLQYLDSNEMAKLFENYGFIVLD